MDPASPCISRQILDHWTARKALEKFCGSSCFHIDPPTLSLYLPAQKPYGFIEELLPSLGSVPIPSQTDWRVTCVTNSAALGVR